MVLVNDSLDAKMDYALDRLSEGSERPASECAVELVRTDDLSSGIDLLEQERFGHNQSEVVRRAISVVHDLNSYVQQGWEACVASVDMLGNESLESFKLRYPPTFVGRSFPAPATNELDSDVSVEGIVAHLVNQFGQSNLLRMAHRWAMLRGQSIDEFFRDCLVAAEDHLAPDFFGGCDTADLVSSRLIQSGLTFRNIVVFAERSESFVPLIDGLAYQLSNGAKVFVMLGTVEHAEARCESILEASKQFARNDPSPDGLYSVSVAGTFMETSGLHYPHFVLFDYDLPILRQGIRWREQDDGFAWKPILGKHLMNAAKHVAHLIQQAEAKGYSLNTLGNASYHSVDLS
ncbi:MAG TPA: hypothetical protein DDW52_19750 [Planctomycetaceae bacterium]|nr:hypothetical protein [Planctomycetaceae bacterium]